jgi:hypothetical protein
MDAMAVICRRRLVTTVLTSLGGFYMDKFFQQRTSY